MKGIDEAKDIITKNIEYACKNTLPWGNQKLRLKGLIAVEWDDGVFYIELDNAHQHRPVTASLNNETQRHLTEQQQQGRSSSWVENVNTELNNNLQNQYQNPQSLKPQNDNNNHSRINGLVRLTNRNDTANSNFNSQSLSQVHIGQQSHTSVPAPQYTSVPLPSENHSTENNDHLRVNSVKSDVEVNLRNNIQNRNEVNDNRSKSGNVALNSEHQGRNLRETVGEEKGRELGDGHDPVSTKLN